MELLEIYLFISVPLVIMMVLIIMPGMPVWLTVAIYLALHLISMHIIRKFYIITKKEGRS